MLSDDNKQFIRYCVDSIVNYLCESNPKIVPGEIYDALAAELERRCRLVINNANKDGRV